MTGDEGTKAVEINESVPPQVVEPKKLTREDLPKRYQKKFDKLMGLRILQCHYCGQVDSKDPLKVERDIKGKKLKTLDGNTVYFHKSCKALHLMGELQRLDTGEENPTEQSIEINQ